eukprot:Gb_08866 [translate_table: standard]
MGHQHVQSSRVLVVDSEQSWDFLMGQARIQACPIVVHFTADWCVPSKYMNSVFEELALKYPDILFLLVDVDEIKGVAAKMDVKAMPTFIFMNEEKQVDKIVGANAEELHKRVALFAKTVRSSVPK